MQYFDISRFYELDKGGMHIAEEAIRDIQKLENDGRISQATGALGRDSRRDGVRTIGVGISTEFIKKGYINLRGKEVQSPEQLAALAQVYRDPRFETLRFFYIKENVIVGHEGITSKMPSSSVAFLDLPDRTDSKSVYEFSRKMRTAQTRFFMSMLNRMERLQADGYYLLHNHPSGTSPIPSTEDIKLTEMYQAALSGFKGHVIINSKKYGLIDEGLNVTVSPLHVGKDKLLTPSMPHPLLGESITSSSKLAGITKSMQLDSDYSVLIYISTKNNIRALQEVPDGLFKREKECVDYLRGRMREFGAARAFVVTGNENIKEIASDMVEKGYLLDAIIANKNCSVTSVRESGIIPSDESKAYWMNRSLIRGVKVSERNKDYQTHRNSDSSKLKTRMDKTPMPVIGL